MVTGAVDLLAVTRGNVREATHAGHLAVTDAAGRLSVRLGKPDRPTYFRSCAKPLQALAGLRTGIRTRFELSDEHVAIMCASHSGEPRHVELVRELLQRANVPESALQCGAHWPGSARVANALRRQMAEPIPVFNNCSGKHAGMLAAAQALGAPLASYLDPEHPVQQRIRATVEEHTGCQPAEIGYGIDGCNAPNPAVPLHAVARSFASLLKADDPEAVAIVRAMSGNPFVIDGTDELDTRLMEVTGGRLLAKGGAAGLHCTADRHSGLALALKLETGDGTWIGVPVIAALSQLGWLDSDESSALREFGQPVLRNHRRVAVGSVSPLFDLSV